MIRQLSAKSIHLSCEGAAVGAEKTGGNIKYDSPTFSQINSPALRGGSGGGGSAATRRKRDERDLLKGLKELLQSFAPQNKATAPPSQGKKNQGRKNQSLLGALKTLIARAEKNHDDLLPKFDKLVAAADDGKIPILDQSKETKPGSKPDTKTKPMTKTKTDAKQSVQSHQTVDTEDWTRVTRRKPKPDKVGGGNDTAKPKPNMPVFHLWRDPTLPHHVSSYKAVSNDLQEGKPPKARIVEVTGPQADDLRNLWQSHDIKNASITLAFVNSEAPAQAKKQWLHVTAGGAPPTVRLVPCLCLGSQASQLPTVKVTQATAPAVAEAAVLRVTFDKQYVSEDEWKRTVSKPANAFHAMTEKKGLTQQIIATYGWRILSASRCSDQVTGFLKVTSSAKDAFLHASGIGGWFIDSLAKHGPKANVEWITPLIDEPRIDYRIRVLSDADGSGVALRQGSGAALGIRTPSRPTDTPKAANWQLDGVPKFWTLENVCSLLTENKWTDVAPISKPQGNRGWILRATPPDNGLCHVFELPNAAPIILHLAAHRGPKRQQKPIARAGCDIRPAVSKWSKAVGGTVASGKIAEATPPKDAMEVEVTHSSNGEEMDTSGQAAKRQTETKGASPEKKRAKAVCTNFDTPFGFQRVDCGGNGDCGY